MLQKIMIVTFVSVFIIGCASPHVIEERQVTDEKLSCSGIKEQIAEADRFERKARDEKGVTGTNVAAALFFWPGMLATYSNSSDAIEAANERKRHLHTLFVNKGCGNGKTTVGDGRGETLSEKLNELNDLHEQGVLSDEEFTAAKRKALGL